MKNFITVFCFVVIGVALVSAVVMAEMALLRFLVHMAFNYDLDPLITLGFVVAIGAAVMSLSVKDDEGDDDYTA